MTILKDKCFSLRFCQTLCVQSGSPDLALHTLILTIRVWLLRPNAQFPSPFNSIPHLLLIILFSTPQLFFCNLPQFFLPSFVFFMVRLSSSWPQQQNLSSHRWRRRISPPPPELKMKCRPSNRKSRLWAVAIGAVLPLNSLPPIPGS